METSRDLDSSSNDYSSSASDASSSTSMTGKADLVKRAVAMIIDGLITAVIGVVPYIGGLVGAAYMVVRDGLELEFMDRRSIGKKLIGLRPVRLDGRPMDIETSIRRNWMWGIGAITSLLFYIPILGWMLIPFVSLVALAIGLFEIYKVVTDEEGRRWGDSMADTKVIENAG